MPASYGTSTVEDLALSSLPSKNNCWGSSLQTASNPWSFRSPERAVTSPPPSPRSLGSQKSPVCACGCCSPPHGGAPSAGPSGRSFLFPLQEGCPGCRPRGRNPVSYELGPDLKLGAVCHPAAPTPLTVMFLMGTVLGCTFLFSSPQTSPGLVHEWAGDMSSPQKSSSICLWAPPHQPGGSLFGLGVGTPGPPHPLLSFGGPLSVELGANKLRAGLVCPIRPYGYGEAGYKREGSLGHYGSRIPFGHTDLPYPDFQPLRLQLLGTGVNASDAASLDLGGSRSARDSWRAASCALH